MFSGRRANRANLQIWGAAGGLLGHRDFRTLCGTAQGCMIGQLIDVQTEAPARAVWMNSVFTGRSSGSIEACELCWHDSRVSGLVRVSVNGP